MFCCILSAILEAHFGDSAPEPRDTPIPNRAAFHPNRSKAHKAIEPVWTFGPWTSAVPLGQEIDRNSLEQVKYVCNPRNKLTAEEEQKCVDGLWESAHLRALAFPKSA